MKNLTLITGGVRSGKSLLAESLANESRLPVHFLATMPLREDDLEQVRRIEKHRRRRPTAWHTIECGACLVAAVESLAPGPAIAILDCLALAITNVMLQNDGEQDPYATEAIVGKAVGEIIGSIEKRPDISFIVVSNETGWGVVPESALGRAFRDFLGAANQEFAKVAERVYLVCAGLKLQLK